MRRTGSSASPWSAAALFGLLAALLLRALIPSGYMIAQGADGTIGITPCSGAAPVAPMPPLHHASGAMHHGSEDQGNNPPPSVKCPYTALLAPPLPAAAPLLPPPALIAEASHRPSWPATSHAAALAAPLPPSTGPPISA